MAWMADQYATHVGERQPGVITGKPLSIGGSAGRGIATALGGLYVLRRYYHHNGESLAGKKVVVQ
jgi:glutamate dehydrogenase/leucine dehydrogenase